MKIKIAEVCRIGLIENLERVRIDSLKKLLSSIYRANALEVIDKLKKPWVFVEVPDFAVLGTFRFAEHRCYDLRILGWIERPFR